MKKTIVYISVFGPANSGKTTLMHLIHKAFKTCGIEMQVAWDSEGPSIIDHTNLKLRDVIEKTKVVLVESLQRKIKGSRHESSEDFQVFVRHTLGKNLGFYRVALSMHGVTLKHDFSDQIPTSKERARSIAARLANELGVEVIDELSNDIDPYSQSKDFSAD